MEERLLSKTAIGSFLCLLVVVALAILFSHGTKAKEEALGNGENTNVAQSNLDNEQQIANFENIASDIGNKYITIKKPDETNYNVQLNNSYMDNKLFITIEDLDSENLKNENIRRVNQHVEFVGSSKIGVVTSDNFNAGSTTVGSTIEKPVVNSKNMYLIPEEIKADGSIMTYGNIPEDMIVDPVNSFVYNSIESTKHKGTLMEFHMDKVYEPVVYQDNDYIYIALKEPKDIYNKIVVIDAGHGGKDPGAYSKNFMAYEKDVNLEIVLQLKTLFETNKDIKIYYTRLEDETVYLNPRVDLANNVQADLFVSIHCNASESTLANGLEVLYNEKDTTNGLNSQKLSEILFNDLRDVTGRINRGLVPASEMLIVGKSTVPVALIETGFITNAKDYAALTDEHSQKEFAQSIYNGIVQALK